MNRRKLVLASLVSPMWLTNVHAAQDDEIIVGIGLSVEEWLDLHGDPDLYEQRHPLLPHEGSYYFPEYTLTTFVPLNEEDLQIRGLKITPTSPKVFEALSKIVEQYLPTDSVEIGRIEGGTGMTVYIDYSSQELKRLFRFEDDLQLDGEMRVTFDRLGPAAPFYTGATLQVGNVFF